MIKTKSNYFVLTGAPGSGKSSTLQTLKAFGHRCIGEPAREILAEQRAVRGTALPEHDKGRFTELLLDRSVANFVAEEPSTTPVFFDRGIVDVVGFAKLFALDTVMFEQAAQNYRYNTTVFVFNPWREIYVTDEERKMGFDEATRFHEQLLASYRHHGYRLVFVPQETVEKRARFVCDQIQSLGDL